MQAFEDKTVTVRERDSIEQESVATDKLLMHLLEKLRKKIKGETTNSPF